MATRDRGKNRQKHTDAYRIYKYLRQKMWRRGETGQRVYFEYTPEEYKEIIDHAMELAYDLHVKQLEKGGID